MMQRPALAVAEHMGEAEDPRLARGQELLAGELRRGVQVERRAAAAGRGELGREGVQVDFVARGHLQRRGLDLQEAAPAEPVPQRRQDAAARQQERPPVGVDVAVPPGRGVGHVILMNLVLMGAENAGERGHIQYGAARNRGAPEALAPAAKPEEYHL